MTSRGSRKRSRGPRRQQSPRQQQPQQVQDAPLNHGPSPSVPYIPNSHAPSAQDEDELDEGEMFEESNPNQEPSRTPVGREQIPDNRYIPASGANEIDVEGMPFSSLDSSVTRPEETQLTFRDPWQLVDNMRRDSYNLNRELFPDMVSPRDTQFPSRHFDDGSGESYRPRPRSPRADYRDRDMVRDRSPRGGRSPQIPGDSYSPGGRDRSPQRYRSRSPLYRGRDRTPARDGGSWRRLRSPPRRSLPRARSPPRRFSPRRDDDWRNRRSPPRRDDRRRSRSPYDRDRPTRARSPPPPQRTFRDRSRSPDRRAPGPNASNWRRRSPSSPRESERSSGRTSESNSRRNSPPVHPSRLPLTQAASRETRRSRSPPYSLAYRGSDRDSARSTPRERSPVRPPPRSPPRGPAATLRAPTGPSSARNFTVPVKSPVMNRNEASASFVPPTGPRGGIPPRGPSFMSRGRGSFSSERPPRSDAAAWGSTSTRISPQLTTQETVPYNTRPTPSPVPSTPTHSTPTIPTGPAATSIPTGPRAGAPTLRPSSTIYSRSSAPPGPRLHPGLSNIPPIIPGGRIDPTSSGIPSDIQARLKKREEEAEVLREELQAKEEKLRKGLRMWGRLERESKSIAGKTELSERHVRLLAGEGVGGKAF